VKQVTVLWKLLAVFLPVFMACHTAAPVRHEQDNEYTLCHNCCQPYKGYFKPVPDDGAADIIITVPLGCHRVEAMHGDQLPNVLRRWYRIEIDGRIVWHHGKLDWGNHRAEKFTVPAGAPGPRPRWQVPFNKRFGNYAPVISGNTVLLKPMANMDGIEHLIALDAKTGREKWKVLNNLNLFPDIVVHGTRVYMGGIRGIYVFNIVTGRREGFIRFTYGQGNVQMLSLHRGVLYAEHDELNYSTEPAGAGCVNYLSAIDPATRRFLWKRRLPDDWGWSTEAHNGVLYQYSAQEKLVALSASNGRVIWTRSFEFPLYTVRAGGEMLCVEGQKFDNTRSVEASIIMGIEAKTGEMKWQYHKQTTRPTVLDGTVYFGNRHYLCALDAKTGKKKWERDMGQRVGTVAIAGGLLYVRLGPDDVARENYVVAVDPTNGAGIWKYGPMPYGRVDFPPVVVDGSMYFYGNDAENLYAFDLP